MLRVFIVFVTLLAICAVIILVDYMRHRSYYSRFQGCKGQKFVFLRVNNKQVRHDLRRAGIRLCPCAEYETHLWLFTTTSTGGLVCGFTEPTMNFVKDAHHNGMIIIDCGISVGKFISQVRNIKQQTMETKTMKNEKITPQDLKLTMSRQGITDAIRQDKVIQRLQVTGCLIAMTSDILDTFFADEEDLLRQLSVTYKHEQKYHKNGMKQAYVKFHYHMRGFNKSFFGNDKFGASFEDNAQDLYDIIKLITDHTNDHKDMEAIKRNLRRRKLNHHIFDEP